MFSNNKMTYLEVDDHFSRCNLQYHVIPWEGAMMRFKTSATIQLLFNKRVMDVSEGWTPVANWRKAHQRGGLPAQLSRAF
jgi:hypothetical protein